MPARSHRGRHVSQPDRTARVIHRRSPNGTRRRALSVRLGDGGRDLIAQRAQAECQGVESEWVRRALRFAAQNMPPNWNG